MTQQLYSVSFRWQLTSDLTSPPVDLWGWGHDAESVVGVVGGRDAGMSGTGVVSVRSAQMMGQQKRREKERQLSSSGCWHG